MLASACSAVGASSAQLTLEAENMSLKTRVAFAQGTATRELDRVAVTLEHAQTEVRQSNQQNQNLIATLVERGFPRNSLLAITPDVSALAPTATPRPVLAPPPPDGALAPEATDEAGADTGISVTRPPPVLALPGLPPTLSNVSMAPGVGPDDCALESASTFAPDAEEIYVVATASNIQPGMTITSRWMRGEVEVAAFDFTPDFAIDGACIWFFIDQTDVDFTPGSYSVQLQINGGNVGAPLPFSIE